MSELNPPTAFDEVSGHRFFAANGFNRTWELIDKPNRTPADDEQMLLRAYASLWHWTQRADCKPQNLSIGYWLVSRVHALLNQPEPARQFGELSLQQATDQPPFYIGYAHEALARAAAIAGDADRRTYHLALANGYAALVTVEEERRLLETDLETV